MVSRRRRGFTLIELLVVIAIILLVVALSLPAVNTFLRGKVFNQAAQQVLAAFMRARSKAITEREKHYVMVFVLDGKMSLPRPSGGTKDIEGKKNTLKVIDSNEKQKVPAKELQSVGDDLILPDQARFDKDYAQFGTPKCGFYVEFLYDGSCIIKGKSAQDAPSSSLYDTAPFSKKPFTSFFDLIIRSVEDPDGDTTERRRAYVDIIQGTGQLKYRIQPL